MCCDTEIKQQMTAVSDKFVYFTIYRYAESTCRRNTDVDNKGTCGDTEAVQRSYFLSGVVGVARCNSRSVICLAAISEFFSVIIFNVIF